MVTLSEVRGTVLPGYVHWGAVLEPNVLSGMYSVCRCLPPPHQLAYLEFLVSQLFVGALHQVLVPLLAMSGWHFGPA